MADAQVALDWLRANLGTGEDPPGSNHNFITEWFGIGDDEWCAMTVSRALNEAFGDPDHWQVPGIPRDFIKGIASVESLRRKFHAIHQFDQEPRVGDVAIIIHTPGSFGDHTGMVEEVVGDGTVVTLEGNAGHLLQRMTRGPEELAGFGHPPYDTVSARKPEPKPERRRELPEMLTYDIATPDGNGQTFLLRSQGKPVFLARGDDVKVMREKAGVPHAGEISVDLHVALMAQ